MGMGQEAVGVSSQGTSQGWKKILQWVEKPLALRGQERSLSSTYRSAAKEFAANTAVI